MILWGSSYSKVISSGIAIHSSKVILLNASGHYEGPLCYPGPPPNLLKTLERWILATHRFAIQKYVMFRVTSFSEILSFKFARSKTSQWVVSILHFLLGLKSNKSKVAEVKVFRNLPSGCTVFGLDDLRLQMDPLWCSLLTNSPKLGASSPGRDRNPMAPIRN